MTEILRKYFPQISDAQIQKFIQLSRLLKEWNQKINLVSRKDIDNLEINHILHSLAIAKFINFKDGTFVMDLGSGGGLPGLPLAILFPEVNFLLADRTGKKVMAASEMAKELELENVRFFHGDAKDIDQKFDFIVNRGVMPQPDIMKIASKKISPENKNSIFNGIISLKGGDLDEEMKTLKNKSEIIDLKAYFKEPFFETKKLVYTHL